MKRARRAKGKRNAPQVSEKAAWRNVLSIAQRIKDRSTRADVRQGAGEMMEIAADMLDQLASGVHTNPPLTVFSMVNPPKGGVLMSDHLYTIEYRHQQNGKNYYHDFRKGTRMHAMPDGTIRISRPGARVWGEFDAE